MCNLTLEDTSQSYQSFLKIEENLDKELFEFAQEHPHWTRLLALPIALCTTLLELSARVASIGEMLIKGITNLILAATGNKKHGILGLRQLFLQIPLQALSAAGDLMGLPILVLSLSISPQGTIIKLQGERLFRHTYLAQDEATACSELKTLYTEKMICRENEFEEHIKPTLRNLPTLLEWSYR